MSPLQSLLDEVVVNAVGIYRSATDHSITYVWYVWKKLLGAPSSLWRNALLSMRRCSRRFDVRRRRKEDRVVAKETKRAGKGLSENDRLYLVESAQITWINQ